MSIARDISRQTSRQTVTLTANQEAVTVSGGFSGSSIEAYHNGVRLIQGSDYILNGTSGITLTQGASAGDIIEFSIRNTSNSGISSVNTSEITDESVTFAKLSNSATESLNVQKRVVKAWVTFDATASMFNNYNVSSVTDHDVGHYKVNFDTNMEDADYCCVCTADVKNAVTNTVACIYRKNLSDSSHAEIVVSRYNNVTTDIDGDIGVAVFR